MSVTRVDVILGALGLTVERVRGSRAWIHCPFHESTSTSAFFVRRHGERSGTFHCFACKAGGSLVELVMHVRSLTGNEGEREARAFVKKAGQGFEPQRRRVRVVARDAEISRSRFRLPSEMRTPAWDAWATEARAYIEERGLGREEVETFGIGYAVDGPLAGRVVIPFLDERGRPGTYSARTLVDDVPKYRTPDEREKPDLETVFASHLWPSVVDRRASVIIVTEGAIDAMSVRRMLLELDAPRTFVGALNGSEPLPGQLLALASFGGVLSATDNDQAGDRAARIIRGAVARHAKHERFLLPADANTLLVEHPRKLRMAIEVALSGIRAP